MVKFKEWLIKNMTVLIAGTIGAFVFITIYGTKILNPCYTDWLMSGGDLSQHYLGWKMYRNGDWTFPIGLTDQLAYPYYTSVIFTDSIPIFAVFFKLLSPILPANFQYFGFWGILCFGLQGMLAAKILKKFLQEDILVILGAVFFILSPICIYRMFAHTALAGQWLILLAIYTIVYYDEKFYKTKNAALVYGILGFLCSTIHLYFVPMVGIVLCAFVLISIVKSQKILQGFLPLISFLSMVMITVYLLGGFTSNMTAQSGGLGHHSFNLNSFFNPMGWSIYLKNLTTYTTGQYEGFAYPGLGLLFLFFVTSLHAVSEIHFPSVKFNKQVAVEKIEITAYILIILLSLITAASPKVSLGEHLLFEIPIPVFIKKIWTVFRASGRLIWSAAYLFVLFAICGDRAFINRCSTQPAHQSEKLGRRIDLKLLILAFCILLQVLDLSDRFKSLHNRFSTEVQYQSMLSDPFWEEAMKEEKIEHFIFTKPSDNALLYSITNLASDNQIDIGNFYFARNINNDMVQKTLDEAWSNPNDKNLYLFTQQEERLKAARFEGNLYYIDDILVGYTGDLNAKKMTAQEIRDLLFIDVTFQDKKYMKGDGEDKDGIRYLEPGSLSYGPYVAAPKGFYKVTILGKGLQDTDIISHYNGGKTKIDIRNLKRSDEKIEYEINATEDIPNLEVLIRNKSDSQIQIKNIRIEILNDGGQEVE